MLVIDNELERKFLEKLVKRLGFPAVSISRTTKLADGLRDFFPDIVFASMLGRSSKTLDALAHIKVERGIPKIVFVRSAKDTVPLNAQQKRIVDGVLYSPIDPFKLIEILSKTTGMELNELKERYRELLGRDRGQQETQVVTSQQPTIGSSSQQPRETLIIDSTRREKYDSIVVGLKEKNKEHQKDFDTKRFKELTKVDPELLQQEDPEQKALKKNFISKLFSATPKKKDA